ncbi:hypothetical protein RDI58_001714 [Solanum bulbocastanum]|uniref:PPM-type phosphatase domain-containing protein n=1 Tax=Solanum bulbocastanum TaxID=147425 RepID=A0AAN8UC97_SOLBU
MQETAEQYFAVTERHLTCLKTRLNYPSERRRVGELGGFIDDGYLNGILSVTRALWTGT